MKHTLGGGCDDPAPLTALRLLSDWFLLFFFLKWLLCSTSGECNSPQRLPPTLIQHIGRRGGGWIVQAGLQADKHGCQSRRVTVGLIRALLICTALISRLSLLQSGN